MEWFAMGIPLGVSLFLFIYFKRSVVWWELTLPLIATALFIISFKLVAETITYSDTEYWGSQVVEARYYEYWDTYVERTCTYTTTCCCDKDGNNCSTETHEYDCSYCDKHSAYWIAIDANGRQFSISQEYYNILKIKWHATPQFMELNRDINRSGRCGTDGDAYSISWDGKVETSENAVTEHDYENKVQVSKSAFNFPKISKKEAHKEGLYDYPEYYSFYKQKVILGLDSLPLNRAWIETKFQYFNGHFGAINKIKLFICLFYDKPQSIATRQEAYWTGGNQNELVVCIGLNKQQEILWVKPFSWTDRKRVLVDIREDIAEIKHFQADSIYGAIEKAVVNNVMYKDFKKDFSYLRVELGTGAMWAVYILSLFISVGVGLWSIKNDYQQEGEDLLNLEI